MDAVVMSFNPIYLTVVLGSALVVFILVYAFSSGRNWRLKMDDGLVGAISTLVVVGFGTFFWWMLSYDSVNERARMAVETTYGIDITDGGVPVGDKITTHSVSAYVNGEPNLQACLISVTPETTYEVVCNGKEIDPR